MKTPDHILTDELVCTSSTGKTITLPQGAFIQPIDPLYVPKHVKEKLKDFNPTTHSYCFCRIGIVLVPKEIIRRV